MQKSVYLFGAITGDPEYRLKFEKAEKTLKEAGYIVLNPTVLPEGLPYEKCMEICFTMIDACDVMYGLDGWEASPGALREYFYGHAKKKEFILNGRTDF
jgi:nucleoside 2-deoxyribosyltransferase